MMMTDFIVPFFACLDRSPTALAGKFANEFLDRKADIEMRRLAFQVSLAKPWLVDSTDFYLNKNLSLARKARIKHNV
tara:strand:+ start:4405 stop:4635 length:231 start_codon:yes stop_codon:yes gene_type:complete